MGCTGIALLSRSTMTHGLQWTPLPSPGLDKSTLGQPHNLLNNQIIILNIFTFIDGIGPHGL